MSTASLTNSTSWAPVGETSFDILNDSVNLIGSTVMCGVSYGAVLPLFCICAYELCHQLKIPERRRQAVFSLVYISALLVLGTMYIASNARTTQLAYVNDRNYPLGPGVYAQVIFYIPVNIMGLFAFFATNWLTDIILIWRLHTVYGGERLAKAVIVVPSIMFLGSFAMSLVTLDESVHVGESFWSKTAVKFVLGYYALSMSLTIVATGLLLIRLLLARRQIIRLLGHAESSSQYLGVAAILVESSALYTIWIVIFIGLYIVNHPVQYVFLATLSGIQTIALLMIIFRVTRGTAWRRNTADEMSTLKFSNQNVKESDLSRSDVVSEATAGKGMEFGTNSDLMHEHKAQV